MAVFFINMNVGINGRIYTPATCHSHPLFSSVQCLLLVRNTGCTSWTCGTGSYRGCDGLGEDLQKEFRGLYLETLLEKQGGHKTE